jgi:acyl-CoA synthetase (AMP-forming)/AMP-acid ligase II
MFLAELEHISKDPLTHDDIRHLRTGVIGGSPIPASLRLTLHNDLNLTGLTNCYGLTESSPIICQTTSTDTQEQKLTTVGRMLPHTSAKIVARDDPNRTLQRGERGELLISGYCVMAGYWKDPAHTSEALVVEKRDDGSEKVWLRSGDEALFQSDGYIRITGRIKDIIIRGGENIYPPEIENVLLQHPVISNASVVGLPDPKYGEVVSAFIILKDGFRGIQSNNGRDDSPAELLVSKNIIQGWVQERLPRMLVPKCVFWIEQMPLTASGKVEKYKLRELGIHLLSSRDPIEPGGV